MDIEVSVTYVRDEQAADELHKIYARLFRPIPEVEDERTPDERVPSSTPDAA